eukprot:scaffold168106_cov36-Tisochrysis_lutea.AAC.2
MSLAVRRRVPARVMREHLPSMKQEGCREASCTVIQYLGRVLALQPAKGGDLGVPAGLVLTDRRRFHRRLLRHLLRLLLGQDRQLLCVLQREDVVTLLLLELLERAFIDLPGEACARARGTRLALRHSFADPSRSGGAEGPPHLICPTLYNL